MGWASKNTQRFIKQGKCGERIPGMDTVLPLECRVVAGIMRWRDGSRGRE